MTNTPYRYRPFLFYLLAFAATWAFWIPAARLGSSDVALALMLCGLCSPAIVAVGFVAASGNRPLRRDFLQKMFSFRRVRWASVGAAVALFLVVAGLSLATSLLFGQPASQFAFTEGFSFSISGASALATIVVASVIEEVAWRGYGEDAIAQRCTWFAESLWFGAIWGPWHLPLFWVEGSYQAGLLELGWPYALNFLVSVVFLGFITTWVYAASERSMLASMVFHPFVNTCQEKIAFTPETKLIETAFVALAATLVVATHRELFFGRGHIGRLPEYRGRD